MSSADAIPPSAAPPPVVNGVNGVHTDATRLSPPQGWTNSPACMCYDFYWRGEDEDLKESLQTDYGLSDPQPLLARDPRSGSVLFLLQSRDSENSRTKYHVWNDVEKTLCWIKSPTSAKDIYEVIHQSNGYLGGLEMEVVKASVLEGGEED